MKIKVTHCQGHGPAFEKLTDGSVHEVVRIDQTEQSGLRGFYVEVDGGEVLLWNGEVTIVEEEGGEK